MTGSCNCGKCNRCKPGAGTWWALGAVGILAAASEIGRAGSRSIPGPYARSGGLASFNQAPDLVDLEAALARESRVGSRSGDVVSDSKPSGREPSAAQVFLSLEARDVPDAMLLGVILAGATQRNPLEVARDLLHEAHGDIGAVSRSDVFRNVKGVGDSGRARVLAAKELVRRAEYRASARSLEGAVTSPEAAVRVLRTMALGDNESLVALYLDTRRRVLATRILTRGSSGFTVVDPRQVFREAVEIGASGVIMAHNHPSGDPTPSSQDYEVTRRTVAAGRVLGIPLLDHLVIASRSGRWTSFAELGEI